MTVKCQDPSLTKALRRLFNGRRGELPSLLSPQNSLENLIFKVNNGKHGVFDHQMYFVGVDDALGIALFTWDQVFICSNECLKKCTEAALVEAPEAIGSPRRVTRLQYERGDDLSICFSRQDGATA